MTIHQGGLHVERHVDGIKACAPVFGGLCSGLRIYKSHAIDTMVVTAKSPQVWPIITLVRCMTSRERFLGVGSVRCTVSDESLTLWIRAENLP
jgi:hypothetical protein